MVVGDYQLDERIGEGGSGQVYRAFGPGKKLVAVKMLGPASDLDEAARARFHREILALGQIEHANLVEMLDHGIDAELGPYLVLPLLAGTSLRSLCGERLCPEAALLVVQPVIEATAALHAAGYVHRDLKPENVIAGPDGTITVIDLGLAWRDGMTRHTDTGAAVGSVGYMAPEQIEGRTVETAADVWALGVMIYELIAGKRPFSRPRPAEEAAAALLGVCPKLTAADRRVGDELAELVTRCLHVDPANRPTASELARAVAAQIDWTDDVADERAAAVADPLGYQHRVAAFQVRRAQRLAQAALEANAPFKALAFCDRGLAYAPNDPQLLALVSRSEVTTGTRPAITRPAKPLWPWVVGCSVVLIGIGVAAKLLVTPSADPWVPSGAPAVTTTTVVPTEGDRKMVGNMINVFGRVMTHDDNTATPTGDRELGKDMLNMFGDVLTRGGIDVKIDPHASERIPTTAPGWLKRAASEEPASALVSVQHAVELDPTSNDAQIALCVMLEANQKSGEAVTACSAVLAKHPSDGYALAARGRAYADLGDVTGSKRDLDAACKAGKKSACAR